MVPTVWVLVSRPGAQCRCIGSHFFDVGRAVPRICLLEPISVEAWVLIGGQRPPFDPGTYWPTT